MQNKLISGLMLLGLLASLGCSGTASLRGTWERMDGEARPDGTRATKLLTADRFAFGVQSDDGEVVYAGGGTYRFAGEVYEEFIEYHWIPALVGMKVEFVCRLEGDVWHHTARFSAGERDFVIDEMWRRISR